MKTCDHDGYETRHDDALLVKISFSLERCRRIHRNVDQIERMIFDFPHVMYAEAQKPWKNTVEHQRMAAQKAERAIAHEADNGIACLYTT